MKNSYSDDASKQAMKVIVKVVCVRGDMMCSTSLITADFSAPLRNEYVFVNRAVNC
jgi:hypothetical protein